MQTPGDTNNLVNCFTVVGLAPPDEEQLPDGQVDSDNELGKAEEPSLERAYRDADKQLGVPDNAPEITTNPKELAHMFRTAVGHVPNDSATNRAYFRLAGARGAVVQRLSGGSVRRALPLANGSEVWVTISKGVVINGGFNLLLPRWPFIH